MAPRPAWKGYLKLSLVSCPVRVYSALARREKVAFNLLHKDTRNRIRMKPHDPELGAVERSDLVKGYQYAKGEYVVFTEDDLEKIQIESSKAIVIEKFVDAGEVDPIHPKAMEVYRNRLILFGCGDFLNDYEGIRGNEEFLDDLTLMYFAGVDPASADLVTLEMVPLQIRRFQLVRASSHDTDWLLQTLDQQSRRFGARVNLKPDGRLALSGRHD